jgi:hypothetical protein
MLGHLVIGAFAAHKSGHALNNLLLRRLGRKEAWEYVVSPARMSPAFVASGQPPSRSADWRCLAHVRPAHPGFFVIATIGAAFVTYLITKTAAMYSPAGAQIRHADGDYQLTPSCSSASWWWYKRSLIFDGAARHCS